MLGYECILNKRNNFDGRNFKRWHNVASKKRIEKWPLKRSSGGVMFAACCAAYLRLNADEEGYPTFAPLYQLSAFEGPSMMPTVHHHGDFFISRMVQPSTNINSFLKRGNVVLCNDPRLAANEINSIDDRSFNSAQRIICKRVIAVQGDTVQMFDFKDEEKKELYVKRCITIPKGYIWLEGDNASWSIDSRHYGLVANESVLGKVVFRVWPLSLSRSYFISDDKPELPKNIPVGPYCGKRSSVIVNDSNT
mmetsp:Transcript_2615/g.3648  ORF Transcript_2615/g.3648 Transcript_2615/m.3648 type:complete len:250 (+) Transcript_2615:126-875(+)